MIFWALDKDARLTEETLVNAIYQYRDKVGKIPDLVTFSPKALEDWLDQTMPAQRYIVDHKYPQSGVAELGPDSFQIYILGKRLDVKVDFGFAGVTVKLENQNAI